MLNHKLHVVILCLFSVNVMFTSLCFVDSKIQKISCFLKTFFSETSFTNYSVREGEKEREGGGEERKEKEKVKIAVSLLSDILLSAQARIWEANILHLD